MKRRKVPEGIVLLVLGSLISFVASAQTNPSYTKLSPQDPVIHLANGEGTENLYLLKAKGQSDPRIKVTDAIGRSSTIPAADIRVGSATIVDANTVVVPVSVKTHVYVEPGTAYDANLLLYGKDQNEPPVAVKFKLEDDSVVSFDAEQTTIAATISDDDSARQRIRIKNSGKSAITSFKITSSTLADSGNQHRAQMEPITQNTIIPAGQYADLEFILPRPPDAGTYTGTVYITANSSAQRSLGLTLQTRGPYSSRHLPLILFFVVVAMEFVISSVLDAWFGSGGLTKAQAYLTMKTAQDQLTEVKDEITKWKPVAAALAPPSRVPQTEMWVSKTLGDIQGIWQVFDTTPLGELTTDSEEFALLGSAARSVWIAIEVATSELSANPSALQTATAGIDTVKLPSSRADLVRYRQDLSAAMASSAGAVKLAASVAAGQTLQAKRRRMDAVREKIHGMNWLYQAAVASVVFITAYQVFFAQKWTFGTLSDYLAVFLWSLGLTTTGTQILARVHKP
jgi:hypothetical protein